LHDGAFDFGVVADRSGSHCDGQRLRGSLGATDAAALAYRSAAADL
jgi:hypothetical protein